MNKIVVGEKNEIYLFFAVLLVLLASKGGVLLPGLSIDDYSYALGGYDSYGLMFSQGRYLQAAVVWLVERASVNINDVYVFFGWIALGLQAIFILSCLRLVRWRSLLVAGLAGALIAAHPYVAEIFTFRMALSGYSLALFLSIVVLESIRVGAQDERPRKAMVLATLAMFGVLLTYQVFVNYFLVLAVFCFMNGVVRNISEGRGVFVGGYYFRVAVALMIVVSVSVFFFLLFTKSVELFGIVKNSPRSSLIALSEISSRLGQAGEALSTIYWRDEPVLSAFFKRISLVVLALSFVSVLVGVVRHGSLLAGIVLLGATAFLVPFSLGVILPFKEWWPVPRVLAHTSLVVSLMLLLAEKMKITARVVGIRFFCYGLAVLAIFGYALKSSQIFADQLKINQWDRLRVNRIVARLEQNLYFKDVQFLYIHGGGWGYPESLRSMQGDMNLSAFFPAWSKIKIFSVVSGYVFKPAEPHMQEVGRVYCEKAEKWPHESAVSIQGNLAVICMTD